MIDPELITEYTGINDRRASEHLARIATLRSFPKGSHLLRAGQRQTDAYVMVEGIARCYSITSGGGELTSCIIWYPGEPAAPCADFSVPSPANMEALVDSTLISFGVEPLLDMMGADAAVNAALFSCMQDAWQLHWNHKEALQGLDNRGRYLWFLSEYPGVIDRIPHYHIASFLSMSPVTLSRIRTKLSEEGE